MAEDSNPSEKSQSATLADLEKDLAKKQESKPESPVTKPRKPARQEKPAPSKSSAPALLWFLSIFNLLVLSAVVAAAYWGYTQWTSQQNNQASYLTEQKTALAKQQQANNDIAALVEQQRSSTNTQIDRLREGLQATEDRVRSTQQSIAEFSGRRPSDWVLAEADYLARMAGRKLWLEDDVRTAIMMLQSADASLQTLSDPSLLSVRQFIANDIQVLRQINPDANDNVRLALAAMLPQVDKLALALPELPPEPADNYATSDSVAQWQENLASAWQYFLDHFINYQSNTQPIRPFLNSQQQWLVREQLSFALLQAQNAVTEKNKVLFEQMMQRAMGMLVAHFDLQDKEVQGYLSGLQNLSQSELAIDYPEQLQSLPVLQNRLNDRMRPTVTEEVTQL